MKKVLFLLIAATATVFFTIMPMEQNKAAAYTGNDVVTIAKKYLGVPYLWGGNTTSGFDCSGYTVYVYKQVGVELPRTAASQYASAGTSVSKSSLQPGDLVFFSNSSTSGVTHVGIYIGSNNFISSTTSKGVSIASLSNTYWGPKYTGAKRVKTSVSAASGSFSDVSSSHYAYKAIETLSEKKIINGFTDGSFRPNNSVTRGQAAAFVNRVLKHTASTASTFKDVSAGHTFAKDIAAVRELGIIQGFSDGTFRPNDTLTRAQMAVIIKNAMKISVPSSAVSSSTYSDVPASYWAYDAVVAMKYIDQTGGYKTTTFRPTDKATRAEFTAALYNGTL